MGAGRVGLSSALAFDLLGHDVLCIDQNEGLIGLVLQKREPFPEPGLQELLRRSRVRFGTVISPDVAECNMVLVAVGTPPLPDGACDTTGVFAVAKAVKELSNGHSPELFVVKSTVPPGTCQALQLVWDRRHSNGSAPTEVVSNPEFLRGGSAIADTLYPDRIVIGVKSNRAALQMRRLYEPLAKGRYPHVPGVTAEHQNGRQAPLISTSPLNAELIKYTANAFLATKLSFINEIAGLAEQLGADIDEVVRGIRLDPRIGSEYMRPGAGWGGPCLGKDVSALIKTAEEHGRDMRILNSVLGVNEERRTLLVRMLGEALGGLDGRQLGIVGLAYKPGSDDVTDSPSVAIAHMAIEAGASVRGYDPAAAKNALAACPGMVLCMDAIELARGCDALILMALAETLPIKQMREVMRTPLLLDGNNLLKREEAERAGFAWIGSGRQVSLGGPA